ncbi:MAG TPA: Maf family protein [Candidatus Obscuribacterales bacterium]
MNKGRSQHNLRAPAGVGSASGKVEQSRQLILASGSPRRVELLKNLGLKFEVMPSSIEEKIDPHLEPPELVVGLAVAKARAVAGRAPAAGRALVLGADTVVVIDGSIIGKPESREQAVEMLSRLSRRCHEVFTGVALVESSGLVLSTGYEVSRVYMRLIDAREMEAYVDTGEPMDKAGAYALQGIGSAFVERIEGCFTNIIGLPVPLVVRLLRGAGVPVLGTT